MAGKRGVYVWGGLAAVAVGLSKGFETVGDKAFSEGDRSAALTGHSLALGLLLAAVVCGLLFIRSLTRKSDDKGTRQTAQVFNDMPRADETFDPDAALANYMAKREQSLPPAQSSAPRPQGFGKRIV